MKMHVLIASHLKDTPQNESKFVSELLACFSGLEWVNPFEGVYVVQMPSSERYLELDKHLKVFAEENTEYFSYIMTPPMTGGGYKGWLPKKKWPQIKAVVARSEDD
jgi:hypothetical protein